MKELVVSTGNTGKLQELQAYLADSSWVLSLKPAELEIAETGESFAANAALKARATAIATGKWSIADDSGLEVTALNGAPGIFSARYADSDPARIARLLQELAGVADRSAQFVCAIAIARPDGSIAVEAAGICSGEILLEPLGDGGFGYDPVFFVPEIGMSFAQMAKDVKQKVSHRGQALAIARQQLLSL
jgi:XTP/dITP diphosphohydrolase